MSRWFRFHAEALEDPKVQTLDGETFKAWVNLLCLASRNCGFLPPIADVAFALRISPDDANTLVERLLNGTLIDKVSGGVNGYRYAPHGWDERQYKSDTSTERVKRYRQRPKPVAETAPDTEAELPLANAKGDDAEKQFWADAKAYLKPHIKGDPGAMISKWLRDNGKELTVAALNAAQLEKAVSPLEYCQGYFRRHRVRPVPNKQEPGSDAAFLERTLADNAKREAWELEHGRPAAAGGTG